MASIPKLGLIMTMGLAALLGLSLGGCKSQGGKAAVKDDFISAGAAEYTVTGSDYVTLEPEWAKKTEAERMQRARALASYRGRAIGFFLKVYVEDKEEGDANIKYGKFNGGVRFGTDPSSSVKAAGGLKYSFNWSFQVAGYNDMIKQINADQKLPPKSADFTLQTADLTNEAMSVLAVGKEWYREDPYQSYNPDTYTLPKRNVAAHIVQQAIDTDAYVPFDQMIVNGKISIAAHFGWDGESPPGPAGERNDILLGRQLYEAFLAEGFTGPVAKGVDYHPFDKATPPLKKMITVNGKPVEVDVVVFFAGQPSKGIPGPDPETNAGGQVALDALKDSFGNRQVIAYLGHSGIGAGFNMSNWNEADIGTLTPPDVTTMKMLQSPQLVLVDGCQTYYLADWFWQNPAKANHKYLNLITSLGFTDAGSFNTIIQVTRAFTKQDGNRMVAPRINTMLKALNPTLPPHVTPTKAFKAGPTGEDEDPVFPVYGTHGIDANPAYNPLANKASLCKPCEQNSDCGSDGGICNTDPVGATYCSFGCTKDAGCGSGYTCAKTKIKDAFGAGICTPATGTGTCGK